jgi:hypothetical protein
LRKLIAKSHRRVQEGIYWENMWRDHRKISEDPIGTAISEQRIN